MVTTVRPIDGSKADTKANIASTHIIVDRLISAGKLLDALDLLCAANTEIHDGSIEKRMMTLRRDAYTELSTTETKVILRAENLISLNHNDDIPSIAAEDLNPITVLNAISD